MNKNISYDDLFERYNWFLERFEELYNILGLVGEGRHPIYAVDQVNIHKQMSYKNGVEDANEVMQWVFSKLDDYDTIKDIADEKIKNLIDKNETY